MPSGMARFLSLKARRFTKVVIGGMLFHGQAIVIETFAQAFSRHAKIVVAERGRPSCMGGE
jgi:hypothetical protein